MKFEVKKGRLHAKSSHVFIWNLRSRGLADDVHKKAAVGEEADAEWRVAIFGHRPVFVVDLAGTDGVGAQAVEVRGDAVFEAGVGGRLAVLRGEGIKKLFGQLAVRIGRVFDE